MNGTHASERLIATWRTRIAPVAVVAILVSTTSVLSGSAAQAGPNCSDILGCSTVINHDDLAVTAMKNWKCTYGTTGTASTTCVSDDVKKSPTYRLAPGEWTPAYQDWDALRVDAGWCYKVQLEAPVTGKVWTMRYDRRGTTQTYVKVENGGFATVLDQSRTSCP